jgi:hypothetical protein
VKMMKAQRDAFEARAEELFPLRVQAILCNHLPERREELEGPRGLSRLRSSIDGARERGFEGERDAAKFVALGVVLGRGFDAEPWAAEIIGDPRFATPTDRIEALWAAAKRRAQDEDARSIAAALR